MEKEKIYRRKIEYKDGFYIINDEKIMKILRSSPKELEKFIEEE